MSTKQGNCWHCGHALSDLDFGREARCPGCSKPVHVCRNCRFFQPGRANDCAEPIAAYVAEKDRANFCDYFQPHAAAYRGPGRSQDTLRDAADALFKT